MVKIRLKRVGTKGKPFYRIVATDGRNPRGGKSLDIIGYYHPRITVNEKVLTKTKFDEEKLLKWYQNGAQFTDTVRRLVREAGLEDKLKK